MRGTSERNGVIRNLFIVLSVFGTYCQMAPAAAGKARHFELGVRRRYILETTVLLNEAGEAAGKDVGFQILGKIDLAAIWNSPDDEDDKLLRLQLHAPALHIKSRKAPAPEGFVAHASQLEHLANAPFYMHWRSGRVDNIYIQQGEHLSMVNLKKGIASLFQFQLLDGDATEKDASGKCQVSYKTINSHAFLKVKTSCANGKSVPLISHPDKVLGVNVTSVRRATYELTKDLSALRSVRVEETHEMAVVMRREASTAVQATTQVTLTDEKGSTTPVTATSLQTAILAVEQESGKILDKMILVTEREPRACTDDCPSLEKLVSDHHDYLLNEHLGTIRSAAAFVRLMTAAREASKEQFVAVLNSDKNKDIILQLGDLAGAAQTREAHAAAMATIFLDSDYDLDLCERYFWALSLGAHPSLDVIKDVLKLTSKDSVKNEKLQETLVLTVAAMTSRFSKLPGNENHKIVEEVKTSLVSSLKACTSEECKQKYLRALQNLGLADTIPTLLGHALTGARKTSVAAMKALRSLPTSSWDDAVHRAVVNIYFQLSKKYDSSARTLALDILLESDPSDATLRDVLWTLNRNDSGYEVRQYLLQRVRQIAEGDERFARRVEALLRREPRLSNYNALVPRGLSTAFTRSFMRGPGGNGSLVTVQEIAGGLLKRGIVDVQLEHSGHTQNMFRLGLFAGGLGSFISSSDEADGEEEEAATAGMELAVMGVQVRPFVFFSGQGELMGHVWSGAGSDKTPAFQTVALVQDHLQYVPLQAGFIAELRLLGGVSFDLSGQIQLSLWNRNAHSLVEKNAGLSILGATRVDTMFVRSQVEFTVSTEARLNLVSDIDFYNNIALCLQLKQPDSVVKHNVFKVERIPGSKHRLRKSRYRARSVAGRTYALNRKNNEMCSVIHSK